MSCFAEAQSLRGRLAAPEKPLDIEILRVQEGVRVIPISRSRHVRGWHPVRPDHPSIAFESKVEARLITWMARLPELVAIRSQPVTVDYRFVGTRGRYTPDFFVELSEIPDELKQLGFARETYVEIKPLKRALSAESKLSRKFAAVRKACKCPVVLLTDCDLSQTSREVRHAA
ncbi:MAG: hypothetical protein LCH89_05905 [Proteobacteria bacterium]|nr:hypothetical protein [Pseudomonadota bacterium]